MSEVTHYSDAADDEIPKRFLCRRKCKEHWWTRAEWLVDCPQCLEKLREARTDAAGDEA